MKKLIIPVILVCLGTGAAFATNANSSKKGTTSISGYRQINVGPSETACLDVRQTCSDVEGDICTWNADNATPLYEFDNPSMCGHVLYKP